MRFFRRIAPMEVVPHGWGIAYGEPWNCSYVICPVPFNLFVGLWRAFRIWMASPIHSFWGRARLIHELYKANRALEKARTRECLKAWYCLQHKLPID